MLKGLPDATRVVFDDGRVVANAGVLLPAVLAGGIGSRGVSALDARDVSARVHLRAPSAPVPCRRSPDTRPRQRRRSLRTPASPGPNNARPRRSHGLNWPHPQQPAPRAALSHLSTSADQSDATHADLTLETVDRNLAVSSSAVPRPTSSPSRGRIADMLLRPA
jgi:hypothetical protein